MRTDRIMDQARLRSRSFVIAVALMALGALATASSAMAEPKGEFKVFKECPVGTEAVVGCLVSRTGSGEIVIGNKKEAKEKTARADREHADAAGRLRRSQRNDRPAAVLRRARGETFSKTGQKVPGGLLDLVKCNEISNFIERVLCEGFFENGVTGVTRSPNWRSPRAASIFNEFALEEELPFRLTRRRLCCR